MEYKLHPCPFCGSDPWFEGDAGEWKDESRYVELSLKCCATMTEIIGWMRARDMTVDQRDAELRERLAKAWNTRHDFSLVAWQVKSREGVWGPPTTKKSVADDLEKVGHKVRPLFTPGEFT